MSNTAGSGNIILVKQNEPEQLKLLRAARVLYLSEKRWLGILFALTWINAIGLALASQSTKSDTSQLLIVAFTSAVIMEGITLLIGRRQLEATKIQEEFDCGLFELPWNDSLGDKVPREIIEEASKRYKEDAAAPVKNWYVGSLEKVPLCSARFLCQRTNCFYDKTLREQYNRLLWIVFGVLTTIVIAIGCGGKMAFVDWLVKVFAPLVPAISFTYRQTLTHSKISSELTQIREKIDTVRKERNFSDQELTTKARQFQDRIFYCRSHNTVIFQWFYKFYRPSVEVTAIDTTNALIDDELKK